MTTTLANNLGLLFLTQTLPGLSAVKKVAEANRIDVASPGAMGDLLKDGATRAFKGLTDAAPAGHPLFRPTNDNAGDLSEREKRAMRLEENQKYLQELDPETDDALETQTNRIMNADEMERVQKEMLKDLRDEAKQIASEAGGDREKIQAWKQGILSATASPKAAAKLYDAAAVEARRYIALGDIPQDNPKDAEFVRDELSRLAAETYNILAGAASVSPFEDIQTRTNLYAGHSFLARGEWETGARLLKSVRKDFQDADAIVSKYETDSKRIEALDSVGTWEATCKAQIQSEHEWDLQNPVLKNVWKTLRQNWYGNEHGTSDRLPRYTLEMEIVSEVKRKVITGEKENLTDALKSVANEGPARLRSRAHEILNNKTSVMESIGRQVRALSDNDALLLAATLAGNALAQEIGMMAKLNALQNLQRQGINGSPALLCANVRQVLMENIALWAHRTGLEAAQGDPGLVFTPEHLAKSYGAGLIMVGGQKWIGGKMQGLAQNGAIKGKALLWTASHASSLGGMIATNRINEILRLTDAKSSLTEEAVGYAKYAFAPKLLNKLLRPTSPKQASAAPVPPTEPQSALFPSTPRPAALPSILGRIMNRPRTEPFPGRSTLAQSEKMRPGTGSDRYQFRTAGEGADAYAATLPGALPKVRGNDEPTLTSPGQPSNRPLLLARKPNARIPSGEDATNVNRTQKAIQDEPSIPAGERKAMSEMITSVGGTVEFYETPHQRRLLQALGKRSDPLGAEARAFSQELSKLKQNLETWSQGATGMKLNRREFEARQDSWTRDVLAQAGKLQQSTFFNNVEEAFANRTDRVRTDLKPLNFALSQMEVASSEIPGGSVKYEIRYLAPKALSEIPMMDKNPQLSLAQIPTKEFATIEIGISKPSQIGDILNTLKRQGLIDASFTMKGRQGILPLIVNGRIVEVPVQFDL